ncbi:MAG: M67 family metallopeptidase [Oscillospiraceae bacterium]|nr:M67 family metallopeptidase [Oscillospiraceae bacterium]
MLKLSGQEFCRWATHAAQALPDEACGLLAGEAHGGDAFVRKIFYLTNIDHSPAHFSMDPREQLAALKELRAEGWQLLGNVHSHPESPARPSQEDIRLAYDPKLRYAILSLVDGTPVIKSFWIRQGVVEEEELRIE